MSSVAKTEEPKEEALSYFKKLMFTENPPGCILKSSVLKVDIVDDFLSKVFVNFNSLTTVPSPRPAQGRACLLIPSRFPFVLVFQPRGTCLGFPSVLLGWMLHNLPVAKRNQALKGFGIFSQASSSFEI